MNNLIEQILRDNENNDERWVQFDATDSSIYFVSNFGRIKRIYVKQCQPRLNPYRGYLSYVVRYRGGKRKTYPVHRLVAQNFLEQPLGKDFVNHKDGNKQNNCVENLEWITKSGNVQHAVNNGLLRTQKRNQGNIKYTDEQIRMGAKLCKSGMELKDAAEKCGVPSKYLSEILSGYRRQVPGIPVHFEWQRHRIHISDEQKKAIIHEVEDLGWTYKQTAAKNGVTYSAVGKIMRGYRAENQS